MTTLGAGDSVEGAGWSFNLARNCAFTSEIATWSPTRGPLNAPAKFGVLRLGKEPYEVGRAEIHFELSRTRIKATDRFIPAIVHVSEEGMRAGRFLSGGVCW